MGEGLDQIRKGGESEYDCAMDALGDAARKDRLISASLYIVPAATGAAQVMASWQTVFRGIQVAQGESHRASWPTMLKSVESHRS